ncbi:MULTISPECIES: helix-turn-helix domain-containing protein [Reichenbachiella]|uniref:AraC-type DNA-binding protein n=1 Tax=Reichenbachiella agariperforans TaxID=156994 RepID=A0A1M6UEH6_REIAG|nr:MULTISPECIES: AraC family transcriptional regulator [Reichenbachiella]MBU2912597.1 AraC family transcriptional regulator [Reichenbachiella agariperforans]RJE72548.1 hypothetical protein BGP76_00835 [Reichenbachiella sp. MSK19-1]SHK67563.1 AraC-type DNA-binding protein [Reichenbachiella agariperforans]
MKQTTVIVYGSNVLENKDKHWLSPQFEVVGTGKALFAIDVVLVPYFLWDEFNKEYPRWFVLEETSVFVLSDDLDTEIQVELLQQGVIDIVSSHVAPILLYTKHQSAMRLRQLSFMGTEELSGSSVFMVTTWLERVTAIIEENIADTEFNVQCLVQTSGMSRSVLYCKLKELTGFSTSEFIRTIRLKHAVALLRSGACSIKEVRYKSGFNSASYFTRCFKKQYGYLPSEYLKSMNTSIVRTLGTGYRDEPIPLKRQYINA